MICTLDQLIQQTVLQTEKKYNDKLFLCEMFYCVQATSALQRSIFSVQFLDTAPAVPQNVYHTRIWVVGKGKFFGVRSWAQATWASSVCWGCNETGSSHGDFPPLLYPIVKLASAKSICTKSGYIVKFINFVRNIVWVLVVIWCCWWRCTKRRRGEGGSGGEVIS